MMNIAYEFVEYGKELQPQENVLVLDVGVKTIPGVIDHHHSEAEPECTASLLVKYPKLVFDHLGEKFFQKENKNLKIITHRLPDFDAIASIFLVLKLVEVREIDSSMRKIAQYTKMADSASIPKNIELSHTPYSILRSLFNDITAKYKSQGEEVVNLERVKEGIKFMNFLYQKTREGYEIIENMLLFSGIDRYEKAMIKVRDDYFNYLADLKSNQKVILSLPLINGQGSKKVDGLIVRNPKSFLLKEWAKRDFRNTVFRKGFSFLLTNFWNKRYILGVDPESGVNLKGLGELLNNREEMKRRKMEKPLNNKWYDGNCPFFNFRIIDSPKDGTVLTHQEVVETLFNFSQKFN